MIDEKEFTAAVENQIKLIKAEVKAFANKIVDLHVDFAQKNAPELINTPVMQNLQEQRDDLTEELEKLLGLSSYEKVLRGALTQLQDEA